MSTNVKGKKKRKHVILVVDDNHVNRSILKDMLGDDYEIVEAENGIEALQKIREMGSRISLMLLDIVMKDMDGLECLEAMNENGWISDIPVIMISTETETNIVERAYNLGATDFIARPFNFNIINKRVFNTLNLYTKQAELVDMVEDEIIARESSVSMMVLVLSQIVEFRNGESGRHVLNVNTLTELLLRRLAQKTDQYNLSQDIISTIKLASSLHDIGKIAIPESILNKPGKLTDEEFDIMKGHSAAGANMLSSMPGTENEPIIRISRDICRWHHERWDGRGYPDGLSGDEIPISAQVVAIADVYDALTSERCYKSAFTHEKALEMIMNGECGAFNPLLLECLNDIADDISDTLARSSFATTSAAKEVVEHMLTDDTVVKDVVPSTRTIELLDYERMKYNFYAQMSNEVQFEYTLTPSMLTINDHSDRKLGLPELIMNPMTDKTLLAVFGEDFMKRLYDAVHSATKENPIVQFDMLGKIGGESRWFHLDSRVMLGEDDQLIGLIGKLVDVHDSHKRMTELEKKATTDSLTGLVNHAYAQQIIAQRMRENPDGQFVLIVLDMDKFKNANDNYGHQFGDAVLKRLAELLSKSVRDDDIVSRVGGDEFLICMEVDGDPKPLVERIFVNCTDTYNGFPIALSMGVDVTKGCESTYDEMFKRADNALYEMKRNGRGGYVYSSDIENNGKSVLSDIESDQK